MRGPHDQRPPRPHDRLLTAPRNAAVLLPTTPGSAPVPRCPGAPFYARRECAAQRWAEALAADTAARILAATGFSQHAVDYARSRAAEFTVAAQHQVRLSPYVRDALRGVRLDSPPAVAA